MAKKTHAIVDMESAKEINQTGIAPPSDNIPEGDRYKDKGQWFTQYGRWIIGNFYNQRRRLFYDQNDSNASGIADEAYINWSYVFGLQPNRSFKFAESTMNNQAIPAPWIPGNKLASLVKHLEGRLLEDIADLKVSADNLTRDVVSKKSKMFEQLNLMFQIKDMLNSFPPGVRYSPVDVPDDVNLETLEDIKDYITKWQDSYSLMAERISRSQISDSHLQELFQRAGVQTFVNNLSGVHTYVENGRVMNEIVEPHEAIWDNRVDNDLNRKAMFAGFLKKLVPYQEIIQKYGANMNDEDVKEIEELAKNDNKQAVQNWASWLNWEGNSRTGPFPWWDNVGTSSMALSYAKIYFIAKRDPGYKVGKNSYGDVRLYKAGSPKQKTTETSDKYAMGGGDQQGDFRLFDLYTVTVIGNKYVVDYGLVPNVIRRPETGYKPELPIRFSCPGMEMGFGRSIVSRLRLNQDNLDYIQNKIIDKFSKDYGKVTFVYGNKLDDTSEKLIEDLKISGIHVIKGSSGEVDDMDSKGLPASFLDISLDSSVQLYIALKQEEERVMEEAVNLSRVALGQQQNTVGKAVQANTINQNSYGTAPIFWGLMKHYEDVLQYNLDVKQLVYTLYDSVEEALTIGDEGTVLLKVLDPKEFGTQQFKLSIRLNNSLSEMERQEIKSIAQAAAQNQEITLLDYVKNIIRKKTPTEIERGLEKSFAQRKKERQEEEYAKMEYQARLQHQQNQTLKAYEAAIIQLKEDNSNFREFVKKMAEANPMLMQKVLEQQPPRSPLQQVNAQGNQPPMQEQQPNGEQAPQEAQPQ